MYKFSTIKYKRDALSLIEVMLTIVILSTSLVLISRSFIASLNASRIVKGYATAELLLEDKIWQIKADGTIVAGIKEQEKFPPPYEEFEYILETKAVEDTREPQGLNEVGLTVAWREGKKNNQVTIVTYLENKPR